MLTQNCSVHVRTLVQLILAVWRWITDRQPLMTVMTSPTLTIAVYKWSGHRFYTEIAQSFTSGILIRDTTYYIVIQCDEAQGNTSRLFRQNVAKGLKSTLCSAFRSSETRARQIASDKIFEYLAISRVCLSLPVSSKAKQQQQQQQPRVFHSFSAWKKKFLPVSSTEIRKKPKMRWNSIFFASSFKVSHSFLH